MGKNTKKRKVKTIYNVLKDYKKKDIDKVLKLLTGRDKEIIELRYGSDLKNPVMSDKWDKACDNRFYSYTMPKIKQMLDGNLNPDFIKGKMGRRVSTIYQLLSDFSKEEVDEVIDLLPEKDKELIKLKYGDDLENPSTSEEFDRKKDAIFRQTLIPNMKRYLLTRDERVLKGKKFMDYRTIYQYFNEYRKRDVNKVISSLSKKDKDLIKLKYGEDLENPILSKEWNKMYAGRFYQTLLPKIRTILEDNYEKIDESLEKSLTSDDYINLLEYINNNRLNNEDNIYSLVISLKLGFIGNNCFSNEEIGEILGIEKDEVISILKDYLEIYRKRLLALYDGISDIVLSDEGMIRKRK